MSIEAHTEQMEAARAEFRKLWAEKILPLARQWMFEESDLKTMEHFCWTAFEAGRKQGK